VGKTVPVLRADAEIFVNCANAKVCGISYDGGYQEYVVAPVAALARMPESIDAAEAAPLLCAGVTAFNSLRHGGALPSDVVAIRGIGGLGHRGIQFAKKFGYRVAALGRGSGNAALAKKRTQSTVAPRSSGRISCGSTGTWVVPSGVTASPG
jgi:D-arabinose 1-dehydrogenase-like Zn-dependent alcohol dehydrogenase